VTDLAGDRNRADAPEAQCGTSKPPTHALARALCNRCAAGRRSVSARGGPRGLFWMTDKLKDKAEPAAAFANYRGKPRFLHSRGFFVRRPLSQGCRAPGGLGGGHRPATARSTDSGAWCG
jgi:hypothetical protein